MYKVKIHCPNLSSFHSIFMVRRSGKSFAVQSGDHFPSEDHLRSRDHLQACTTPLYNTFSLKYMVVYMSMEKHTTRNLRRIPNLSFFVCLFCLKPFPTVTPRNSQNPIQSLICDKQCTCIGLETHLILSLTQ